VTASVSVGIATVVYWEFAANTVSSVPRTNPDSVICWHTYVGVALSQHNTAVSCVGPIPIVSADVDAEITVCDASFVRVPLLMLAS
jgi:hypothetical protein